MDSCYIEQLKHQSRQTLFQEVSLEAVAQIEKEVALLDIDGYLERHPPVYDMRQHENMPLRSCNKTTMNIWSMGADTRVREGRLKERYEYNMQTNWTYYAQKAVLAASAAFELVRIPLVIIDGTSLGWYRECGIIEHTEDNDLFFSAEYIVSLEHLKLLQVCQI